MISKSNFNRQLSLIFVLITFFSISTLSQTIFITKLSDINFGEGFGRYNSELIDTDNNVAKFQFYNTRWFKRTLFISLNLPSTLNYSNNSVPINFQQEHASWSYNDQITGRRNFDPHSVLAINNNWFYRKIYLWLGGSVPDTVGRPPGLYQGTVILTVAY